jgi:hypothetical protein
MFHVRPALPLKTRQKSFVSIAERVFVVECKETKDRKRKVP